MNLAYEKVAGKIPKVSDWLTAHKLSIKTLGLALLSAVLLYLCLEVGNRNFLLNGFLYTGINIVTVFCLSGAVFLIVRRWWIASAIVSVPVAALAVVNYYTLLFRNQPVSTQDIHNAGTTMSVLGSYKFNLSINVVLIILLFAVNIFLVVGMYRLEKGRKRSFKREIIKSGCLILAGFLFLYGVYFAKHSVKPKNTFVWSWEDTYYKYGFVASTIEVFQSSLNVVNKPEGYDENSIMSVADQKATYTDYQTPDIILILNETFYDLRDILDVKPDTEIMPFIDGLENCIKGRVVVAGTGGGTNKSEYELLTSNSLQIMPGITPFNYLNFNDANSIVSHLEKLGYSTWGAHCAPSLNYSRGNVYPKLGFDTVKFDSDFKNKELYGARHYVTDEACYKEMLTDYEAMGDNPRFMYMLTIQNHGGWELNDESMDKVHTLNDFGDYTDDINEFLTCIRMSDEAFKNITEYFKNSDRPVIVCMMGDHSPSFASEIVTERDEETVFKLRSTPYVMWANFDIENPRTENISMPMIVPKMLEAAKVELSPYYSYMLELSENVPIITANNVYKDRNGRIYCYDKDGSPYKDEINTYFNLVYNNVKDNPGNKLFKPIK